MLLLLLIGRALCADMTRNEDPLSSRCVEACMLLNGQALSTISNERVWNRLAVYSNTPQESIELFSSGGASLYIKGEASCLSEAVLQQRTKATDIYRKMQKERSGEDRYYTWNEKKDGLILTDVSWLHCHDSALSPIIVITRNTPFKDDPKAPLAGTWSGAYTEKRWTSNAPLPAHQVGQMNALFLPLDHQFFFRLGGQYLSIRGHGRLVHDQLAAVSTPDKNLLNTYWYLKGVLNIESNTIRGELSGTFNGDILERKFFLKKINPER